MSFAEKFWHWIVGGEVEEEEIIELPLPEEKKPARKSNLVSIQQPPKAVKVMVSEPTTFEETQSISDNLKNRRQVILNLERTPADLKQRIIDFISGTTYALDGTTQKLGENIFLFAPSNVEVSRDPRLLLRSNSVYTTGTVFRGDE